ncbi:MAG: OmpA family protein [Bacteroidales bacterium]|nr:OmpA family protein [Bacteroidales bacterium]
MVQFSGSIIFSLDPMLQVSYKLFRKIPVEFVARTYYQAMFSKMSVSWLGDFEGYWSPADTASKKVTGGNLGIILAIKVNIPEISFKHRSKNVEPVVIEPVYEEKTNFVLSGTVQDAKTSLPLNAVITLYQGTNPIESVISQSGKFTLKPALNSDYTIETKAFGYQTKTEKLRFDSKSPNPYKYNVKLSKIPAGQAIVLENILFEKSSAVLLPESYTELNKLLQFMNDDSEIRIEIAGHTSSDGDDAYNMKLSQDRANSVATYLINKGIDKTRIVAKGYGETMPVASNDTEEGRRLNRRVEFKIVK